MGVRIDSSVSAAKASAQQAAAKKDGQPAAAGTDTDFSEVLAKARPKKKVDAAPPSDKPAPVAKAAGKKKARAKDDPADDAQPVTPGDPAAKRAKVEGHGDDAAPVDDTDADTSPAAAADDDDDDAKSDSDTTADDATTTTTTNMPPVVATVPAPVVAQAAPTPAPAQSSAAPVATGALTAKAVTAAPVESQPAAGKAGSLPAKDQKGVEVPAGHEVEDAQPAAAPEEPKVAIHPTNQPQDDSAPSDGQQGGPEVRGQAKPNAAQVATAASPAAQFNELFQTAADRMSDPGTEKSADKAPSPADLALTAATTSNTPTPKAADTKPAQPPAAPVAPDVRFAADNHPKVVTAVKSQLLPGGGSIQLRLDPPDLGPLRLEVRMEDGSMSASFVTASDQATSLLTHTLGQLKHALEGAGISVDKLQVRQGSADQFADGSDQRQPQQGAAGDQSSARQEQQRREMLNRMWQKVAGGDPLDLVA